MPNKSFPPKKQIKMKKNQNMHQKSFSSTNNMMNKPMKMNNSQNIQPPSWLASYSTSNTQNKMKRPPPKKENVKMHHKDFAKSFLSISEASKLQIHDKVDIRDQVGRFVYSTVAEKSGTNLKLHHDGWYVIIYKVIHMIKCIIYIYILYTHKGVGNGIHGVIIQKNYIDLLILVQYQNDLLIDLNH